MVTKRDRDRDKEERYSSMAPPPAAEKAKMWKEDQPDAGGMDELLAVLGYKVWSSDMADVAHKLEQLEMAMGTNTEDRISQLLDTVHYNLVDISRWVHSMMSELGTAITPSDQNALAPPNESSSTITDFTNGKQSNQIYVDDSEYDLRAIPGGAIYV